jgi:hypothetical protein
MNYYTKPVPKETGFLFPHPILKSRDSPKERGAIDEIDQFYFLEFFVLFLFEYFVYLFVKFWDFIFNSIPTRSFHEGSRPKTKNPHISVRVLNLKSAIANQKSAI